MIVTKIRATISVVVAEKSAQCDALKFPELKKALGQLIVRKGGGLNVDLS